jgi:hypothetical protein
MFAVESKPRRRRREEGNVLGWQTGIWSTAAKVWGIMPKAAWCWVGDSSVANYSMGHRAAPCRMYAFHLYGALLVVTV